jgi:hypothetical protein
MSYRIDKAQNVIFMEGHGTLTDADMVDCIRRLREDADLERHMATLSDMRAVERLAITTSGIETMIGLMKASDAKRGAARAAIVAAEDVQFGMARMFQSKAEDTVNPQVQVFRDMAAARIWIGLAPES